MKKRYLSILDDLISYAKSEGYEYISLNYNDTSSIIVSHNIKIYRGHSAEVKVYLFLHELGHHELRKDWDLFKLNYPIIAEAEDAFYNGNKRLVRRNAYLVESLREEYLAWDIGFELSKKFGIEIDIKKWEKLRVSCLKRYINFYGRKVS